MRDTREDHVHTNRTVFIHLFFYFFNLHYQCYFEEKKERAEEIWISVRVLDHCSNVI